MGNELLELCKEVYEKTGWREPSFGGLFPNYTSDYLLEKLPKNVDGAGFLLQFDGSESDGWCAYYKEQPVKHKAFYFDTPLEALLKLTLSLHEAGELK